MVPGAGDTEIEGSSWITTAEVFVVRVQLGSVIEITHL
jgi:hypothetical protein